MMGIIVGMSGCEDRLDTPTSSSDKGKLVEVSLCVGLADEVNAASLGATASATKRGEGSGFKTRLIPLAATKAITVPDDPLSTAKPSKLFGLQILQYSYGSDNTAPIGFIDLNDVKIGSSFTGTLSDNNGNDCQLVIIARGYNGSGNTVGTLQGKTLSSVCSTVVTSSAIDAIVSESDIDRMPYLLHLPKARIVNDGGTYKIVSPEGTDVRILLRRLATRLTVAWENLAANTGYDLKQVMLQSIPAEYKLLPDNKNSYPSLLDRYKTIQISNISDKGQYTCWIPTVVREESANATSDYYRTKANAPKGSAFATFISQADSKKKLNYRVYLGGNSSKDFSLYDNTNYIYKVTMDHTSLPVDDKRITIIDPIPASVNNNNLVPTANCFMVVPGGAFCFNPYTYYINGASDKNTVLQSVSWCNVSNGTITTPIKSVKVLWQTLEDGDLGDPVLGVVNTYAPGKVNDDHTNIVDLKNGDNLTEARIYCRVAPNTAGGSGMIAAYSGENGTGDILWSWHIWVTDYSPSAIANESVDDVNKRIQKYTYGNKTQYPMMDRNLGAMAGYTVVPPTLLERSKTNGFHYQWGRKDPFPSTYSANSPSSITINSDQLTPGMLNLYQPDGVSYFVRKTLSVQYTIRQAFQNPTVIASASYDSWCSQSTEYLWNDSQGNCSVLAACHTDEIPEVAKEGATLELESVSILGENSTKGAMTSVNKVRLYLMDKNSTWVNPEFIQSNGTWGCTSAPSLDAETDVYAYYPTLENGTAITVTSSSGVYSIPISIRSTDTFAGEQVDYLYAAPVKVSKTSKVVSLILKHALTKVSFQIYKSTNASDEKLTLKKIEIRSNTGRLQTGIGNMRLNGTGTEMGSLTGLAGSSQIVLTGSQLLETSLTQPNVYCLVAPMNATEQVLSFRLTVDVDGVEREFETSSISSSSSTGVKWKAGKDYVYKIRIDKMEGTFEGVTVYDWQSSTDQDTSVGI
ncbi:fimbrillin family protein [Parabacteroides distasonis]|nr:fimbrillin family protein [Parabacteroides distasonis]MDB9151831.1 fimbrillin family protein [Parabacteroides distasonis]MDB9155918.1 fimbrillin family protein [Parabacteroides distasonis]MDB9195786.1 fimbrillin family protein [Parabacteroides distasonis]